MAYAITIRTNAHRYATLAEAKKVAGDIYVATGIIVGIEYAPDAERGV